MQNSGYFFIGTIKLSCTGSADAGPTAVSGWGGFTNIGYGAIYGEVVQEGPLVLPINAVRFVTQDDTYPTLNRASRHHVWIKTI